jgi:hypothetical protein
VVRLVANIAYLCLAVYELITCASPCAFVCGPVIGVHGKRYRICGRTVQAELAVTSCTSRASVDSMWCKIWSSSGRGSLACVLHASSSETSRLLCPFNSDQHPMHWCFSFAAAAIVSSFTFQSLNPGQGRSYDI